MTRRKRIAVGILVLYFAVYFILSRRGFSEAAANDWPGFYYFSPRPTRQWEVVNGTCRVLFAPLNYFDCLLSFGMEPCSDPMWHLS